MTCSVLVTGGAGYLGSVLVGQLLQAGHRVVVLDRFYFGREPSALLARAYPDQLTLARGDVRTMDAGLCSGVDAVVHLAGIANDPACEIDPALTRSLNVDGALHVLDVALRSGVSRFVFASSCSVYGRGSGGQLTEESELHPVSLYASCKAEVEEAVLRLCGRGMAMTVLRFATAFGASTRMRFDLAVNVMTKNAYAQRRITIDGGGRQWRPFVHVGDVAEIVRAVLAAPPATVDGQVINVGHESNNLRILNLAFRVRDAVPGTEVLMAPTDPDLRDYRVRFDKLAALFPTQRFRTVDEGIREVLDCLKSGAVDPDDRRCYTLRQYDFLRAVEETFRDVALEGKVLS